MPKRNGQGANGNNVQPNEEVQNGQVNEEIENLQANDEVEIEPVPNVLDDNELRRVDALNEEDIKAFEGEVAEEQAEIEQDFEEIGFQDTADIKEGLLQSFNSDLYNDSLSFERTAAYKNTFIKTLAQEKDALADKNGPAGAAIDAQTDALKNNWGVNDMDLIREITLSVKTAQDEELKTDGGELLESIKNIHTGTVDLRDYILDGMEAYCRKLADKGQDMESSRLLGLVEAARTRDLHYTEFPEDETVHDIANRKGAFNTLVEGVDNENVKAKNGKPGIDYKKLERKYMLLAMEHNKKSYEEKQEIRAKGDYVMQKSDDVEQEEFKQNYVQDMAGIKISNRTAAKKVFGDNVFDGSDALHEQAERADRTVKIHNANGNKSLLKGENVLEIDVAGSGLHLTERDYHGFAGNTYNGKNLKLWEEPIKLQYGDRTPVTGFPDVHSVRKKETNIRVGDKNVNKTRYTIPGPMPKPNSRGWFHGLLDTGKYKIHNSNAIALQVAKDYLTPIFNTWIEEKKKNPDFEPENLNINVSGYSRGAVSAGVSVKDIRDWVSNHPEYKQFNDKVKYQTILYDPVPGPDGSMKGHGKIDFRKDEKPDPNLDLTLIHSLSVNHSNFFDPQSVRGASRIILGTTMHACTQDMVDNSQRGIVGDGKTHRKGFFDTSTGECYRGSGLSDLPKGVYFSDENQNLVRLTSYSQMPKLLKSLELDRESTSKSWKRFIPGTEAYARRMQDSRRDIIAGAVKDYMLDNPLDISYESEHERAYEHKKFEKTVDKLIEDTKAKNSMSKQEYETFQSFQEKLEEYASADKNTKEGRELRTAILKDAADLMRADKGKPETSDRLEKISDVYSILQRDMVYEEKGLTPSKGRQQLSDSALRAQSMKANSRYEKFGHMQEQLGDISKKAGKLLEDMQNHLKSGGSNNSSEYNKFYYAVKKVSELSADSSSISEIRTALEDMYKASDQYIEKKTGGLFKTGSDFGKKRIEFAKDARSMASGLMQEADSAFDGITRTDMTIQEHMEYQTVRINELADIREKKRAPKKKVKEEAVENKEEAAPEKKDEVKAEEPKAEPNAQEAKAEPEMRKGPSFSVGAEPEAQEAKAEPEVRKGPRFSIGAEPEAKEAKSEPEVRKGPSFSIGAEPKHPEPEKEEPKKEEPKKAAQKPDSTKAHNVDGWDSENYFYDSNAAAKAREAAKQDKEGARKKISLTELSEREGVQKKREFTNLSVESRTHEANMKKVSQTGMKK
ncbi:MAG: hypothetical protein J6N53_00585 [Lachnospiraceae bacterium]|nr:hypothetical protein [Lachnospiraceae bacterium]MBO6297313.1 hypothetical protein [Lachnospiraceae bacterium]MBP3297231.1 hypothetical protein [Lachnospiraceae bacterium]